MLIVYVLASVIDELMCIKMRRFVHRLFTSKQKYILLVVLSIMYIFGVFTHLFEENFYEKFTYPLEGNIIKYVEQIRRNEKPDQEPINLYSYKFLYSSKSKCTVNAGEKLRLVYLVKSAMNNFDRRSAIRQSWGYENRFSDVLIRTVFLLGTGFDKSLQANIDKEYNEYGDIVQADFVDTYFNNTIKTMIGFKWAVENCANSKFYFFSDDDMYVSTKNVLRFIRNPVNYPGYLQQPITSVGDDSGSNLNIGNNRRDFKEVKDTLPSRNMKQVLDLELPVDVVLYSGYVFLSSPHRHFTSKWYISLDEYPYHMWPPYVAAGAYILSHEALINLYYGSLYTKHFRFDDIYLGIVAKKMNIEPFHCHEFYFYKKDYNIYNYKYTIASHGYGDPVELLRVWNEQRSGNNA